MKYTIGTIIIHSPYNDFNPITPNSIGRIVDVHDIPEMAHVLTKPWGYFVEFNNGIYGCYADECMSIDTYVANKKRKRSELT